MIDGMDQGGRGSEEHDVPFNDQVLTDETETLPKAGPVYKTPETPTDKTRRHITYALLALLSAEAAVAAVAAYLHPPAWDHIKDYLATVFVATTTLTASALGFYFGERDRH